METKRKIKILTECSIMIALSTVLSIIKLLELPYGGSITVASMLPIVIISYRHGIKAGFGAALAYSVIQLLLGINNLSYFTTWYSVVAIILLDYIVAFAVFGLSGVFKGRFQSSALALTLGTLLCSLLRYACHVISGSTVWAGLSIPSSAAFIYSVGYNATYMIPETVVLSLAVFYIASVMALDKNIPTPKMREKLDTGATVLSLLAGLSILIGLVVDTVLVFAKLQNEDSGEFAITGLSEVNLTAVIIVTVTSLAIAAVLFFIASHRKIK